jgi:O-antigen/teichoic acid export membrane protein
LLCYLILISDGFKGKAMSKFKLFIENFFVYGLGSVISKIIPLIMVPIVTRLMPSSDYYGLSDLSNTVVSFASALAVMGMYDAMYRMFFEKDDEEYKKSICSTALLFTLTTSVVVFVAMLLLKEQIAHAFFGNREYAYLVYLSAMATLVGATNSIISAPTRMQNKRKIFLITNTVSPLISYLVSIPMLLAGYYTIALPLAAVVSGVVMEITFGILNHSWFNFKRFDFSLLKQLLIIAIPLLPNFLIYWIFNSCDKVMITNMIGIGAAGIYSVGSKLGHASQLIYTAFAGGWQFFAFSTMNEDNQVKNNSLIFEYLGIISFAATTFICAWSYPIFKLLFTDQYLSGYIVAPYLFLAPLLQMLFQVACNQFLVIKKTWPNMIILFFGAVVNIAINYFLIPILGIEGASLATLFGYVVSDVVGVVVLYKMKLMILEKRFIWAALGMVGYFVVWRLLITSNWPVGTLFAFVAVVFFAYLYKKELIDVVRALRKR